MRLIPSIIFCIITYFMVGFQLSASRFFVYLLTIFLSTVFGSSTCFLVASSIPVFGMKKTFIYFKKIYSLFCFSGFIDYRCIYICCNDGIQWFSN